MPLANRECDCEFESDVLAAAIQSRWPERADPELRAHVQGCAICASVAEVAGAIADAHYELRSAELVPDSGSVWWRARLRARREAARTAGRPITAAQVLAFACAVALLGACFGATSLWFQDALRWMQASLADLPSFPALLVEHGALAAGMALVFLLVPAAVWLAVGRD